MAIKQTGESVRFDYAGNVQEFIAPVEGLYKLEVWGASGGNGFSEHAINGMGGMGGYSCRHIFLEADSHLFICAGGRGHDNTDLKWEYDEDDNYNGYNKDTDGGYNGGSNGGDNVHNGSNMGGGGGGGATHIAITTNRGELYNYASYQHEILIVAGGGGGGSGYSGDPSDPEEDNENYNNKPSTSWDGGHGGGLSGTNAIGCGTHGQADNPASYAGLSTSFGKGYYRKAPYAGGGGGGWYGGSQGRQEAPGAGGTGYIGTPSFVYRGITYENSTQTGINNGNGSALITLMQSTAPPVYLGTNAISSIYFGTHGITDIKFRGQ